MRAGTATPRPRPRSCTAPWNWPCDRTTTAPPNCSGGPRRRRTHRHRQAAPRGRRGRRDGPRRALDPDRAHAEGRLMPTCDEGHARTPRTTARCAAVRCGRHADQLSRRTAGALPCMSRTRRRSLLRGVRERFGTPAPRRALSHDGDGAAVSGRVDRRRRRRSRVLRAGHRPRRPGHRRVPRGVSRAPDHVAAQHHPDRPATPGAGGASPASISASIPSTAASPLSTRCFGCAPPA